MAVLVAAQHAGPRQKFDRINLGFEFALIPAGARRRDFPVRINSRRCAAAPAIGRETAIA